MFRKLFPPFLLGLALSFSQAQTISVTATLTDSDGQTWNNGTCQINLVNSSYGPSYYQGTQLPTSYACAIDGSGNLTATLYNTSSITPGVAQYTFNMCPQASVSCTSATIPIITADQSTTLSNMLVAPRFNTGPGAYGYLDAEAIPVSLGGQYYNVTNQGSRQCTAITNRACTTWAAFVGTDQTNYRVPNIYTGTTTATNQDNRGSLTLVAGTKSYTFTQGNGVAGVWTTAPICQVQDQVFANQGNTTLTVTASTLTIANATNTTDTYTYLCWPGN
jgi:hypothetical protein